MYDTFSFLKLTSQKKTFLRSFFILKIIRFSFWWRWRQNLLIEKTTFGKIFIESESLITKIQALSESAPGGSWGCNGRPSILMVNWGKQIWAILFRWYWVSSGRDRNHSHPSSEFSKLGCWKTKLADWVVAVVSVESSSRSTSSVSSFSLSILFSVFDGGDKEDERVESGGRACESWSSIFFRRKQKHNLLNVKNKQIEMTKKQQI